MMKSYWAIFFLFCTGSFFTHSNIFAQPFRDSVNKRQIIILNAQRLNYEKRDTVEYQSAAGQV